MSDFDLWQPTDASKFGDGSVRVYPAESVSMAEHMALKAAAYELLIALNHHTVKVSYPDGAWRFPDAKAKVEKLLNYSW